MTGVESARPDGSGYLLSELDLQLFGEGTHYDLAKKLGAHAHTVDGVVGTVFAVWAPGVQQVRVVGDWNDWSGDAITSGAPNLMRPIGQSGVWEIFVPCTVAGQRYKYRIRTRDGRELEKADPFARWSELAPGNASRLAENLHQWSDAPWMLERANRQSAAAPISVYEVHLGSWMRGGEHGEHPLNYRDLGPKLGAYCNEHGYTHVECMPIMEHPFTGSWGYQVTGFFAPTARYGSPDDFRYFVDELHRLNVGVLLDWVPAHFPDDAHGLSRFNGEALFEHADPREGRHPDWGSLIFNYGRREVVAFLISNALYWFEEFHIDGLRVDAVASMLYRDYSRAAGEWIPNRYGGRENLEAIALLRRCSGEVRLRHPDVMFIAEESTSWPGVTAPTSDGGLGFTSKWDLGWMHDTLEYLGRETVHRRWHHDELTFRSMYAGAEHFTLPLSHDEVVHGKGSLLNKMAGDDWQQRANLRLLFGLQFATPGKKLVFMGGEFAMLREWDHDRSIDWHLLDDDRHAGMLRWCQELNSQLATQPALHKLDSDSRGFSWISADDREQSVYAWQRNGPSPDDGVMVIANCTPEPRDNYRIGLPAGGSWVLLANSDEARFGGSGYQVAGVVIAQNYPWHGREWSAEFRIPPLALLMFGVAARADCGTAQ